MLIKRKSGERQPQQAAGRHRGPRVERHGSPRLPAPVRPHRRRPRRRRVDQFRRREEGGGRRQPAPGRRQRDHRQEHLHPLLRRLHGDGRGRRTGSGSARSRPGTARSTAAPTAPRAPPCARPSAGRAAEIPDEARQRPVAADLVGSGDQRDRRQDARHPREVRRRLGVLAGLGQVLERGRLPDAQVRRLLGHELDRPPGAHLPLDHGRGRRQHLGLRRPDQFLQRHPQRQDAPVHRLERRRGASGRGPAPPGRARRSTRPT